MMGLANSAFARSEDDNKQSNHSQKTQSVTGNYDYEPPYITTFLNIDLTPLNKLRSILGYKGRNRDSKYYFSKVPTAWSKFQLIVDESAKIVDCTLLESSNPNKDDTVIKFLLSSDFFSSPATLNGVPCKSIVLLSMCYYVNGDLDHDINSYPVMNLPDSELETAASNSSPNN